MGPAEKSLLIRADANARMGTGHLMRCLALAQGWKSQGGQVTFVTACKSDSLRQRLLDGGFEVVALRRSYPDAIDWDRTQQALAAHPDAWMVLDGYHFTPAYQRRVKEAGHPLLVIDDMAHLDYYYADVVLNQNINAGELHYACEPYTRLLLCTRYALLRSEFQACQTWRRQVPAIARRVLVTLGGGDPDNQTLKVIQALQRMAVDDLEVTVIVGVSNPHFHTLQAAAHDLPCTVHLRQNVQNMPEMMAWADVAVSAGGSTCWELAFMELPNVILVVAENQRGIAAGLDKAGAALNLGWYTEVTSGQMAGALLALLSDYDLRLRMSRLGRELVDGLGIQRVIKVLQTQPGDD